MSSETRLALYRVAQEALTNIGKHARPGKVEVTLTYQPEAISLVVEDIRAGDAPEAAPAPVTASAGGGYGLTGMRERAELLGGTLVLARPATASGSSCGCPREHPGAGRR